MSYLAQQPGGLSDAMFAENPRQSNRERNWFKVNWTMPVLHLYHTFNTNNEFNLRVFGLYTYRYSLRFRPNRVASLGDNSERDLIKGDFQNYGAEARFLKRYYVAKKQAVLLVGSRYYHGYNHSIQGLGSTGRDANFTVIDDALAIASDYQFPKRIVFYRKYFLPRR